MIDDKYFNEALGTAITLAIFVVLGFFIKKITRRYARAAALSEHRTNLISKYIDIFLILMLFIIIFAVWGVNKADLYAVFSTTFAVIGVAFFAQWSILSNITSGVILFFTFPFRIGDTIKIMDKDFPLEGQIEDIKAFHTILKTKEGELVTYPNSLLLQKGVTIVPESHEEKEFFD